MEELEKLNELISGMDAKNKEILLPIIDIIDEIKKNLIVEPNAYIHLILREKYFILIQTTIESNNDLMVKFVFNSLQKYFIDESSCELCSIKEKSQFLLNILRYIQHTHLNNEITKLEIFKFLLNNHEIIEPLLNSKTLSSLIEISINESECDNKFVQSSSKALIIKYVAVVCNQISSIKNSKNKNESFENEMMNLDSFLVSTFSNLLNIFNQDHRSFEIRNLILECIELLLNNLIVEKQNFYDIRKNQSFIEFAWQNFCPSILFQFGECGLPSKINSNQTLNFKQIYTILIQLTGLIGGNKTMIPVFEAIFQRILFYPPEQDNHILLKLFKAYVNRDFVTSLTIIDSNETTEPNTETIETSAKNNFNEFTLINLNCYERSIKTPNDKMLQLLSCECINSFVKLIYDLFEENMIMKTRTISSDNLVNFAINFNQNQKKHLNSNMNFQNNKDDNLYDSMKASAVTYVEKLGELLSKLMEFNSIDFDIDFKIKQFCLNILEKNEKDNLFQKKFFANPNKIHATTYLSFYVLFKSLHETSKLINLTNFTFDPENNDHKDFFIHRVLIYDDCDANESSNNNEFSYYFREWLGFVYEHLLQFSKNKSDFLTTFINSEKNVYKEQTYFILRQMDCLTRVKISKGSKSVTNNKEFKLDLIKKLLKCSWTYLIDVLVGYLLNSSLDNLEHILFHENILIEEEQENNMNTDFSFTIFAFKSTLDSLYQIIKIISYLDGMDRELSQLFFILIDSNFFKNNCLTTNSLELSLNKIICLDFVLYVTTELVCNLEPNKSKFYLDVSSNQITYEILWKYLIETTFFCLNLQANLEFINSNSELDSKTQNSQETNNLTKFLLNKKQKLFRSVYTNLNEINENYNPNSRVKSVSIDLNNRLHQSDIIMKNIFFFLNDKNVKNEIKFNKLELIDNLSNQIYDFLFNQLLNNILLDKPFLFDYIWQLSSNLCLFSKRFLIDESSLRKQHEYFSFNNLIIDKLEDFLIKLINKLKSDQTSTPQNIDHSLAKLDYIEIPKPNSIISIFFTDLWLNVFVNYFQKIFSKCGSLAHSKIKKANNSTGKSYTKSTSFNLFSSNKKTTSKKFDLSGNFVVDLSICKKLIYLIQKLFEIYNNKLTIDQNMSYLEMVKNSLKMKQEHCDLVRTPSTSSCSAISTPVSSNFQEHDFSDSNDLISKLEIYKNDLNNSNKLIVSSRLFYNTAASILMPSVHFTNDLVEIYLIDERYNLNSIFLLPFYNLMTSKTLETNLKDSILTSICELVEGSSFKIKTSWNMLFNCLSRVDLNEKVKKTKKRKSRKRKLQKNTEKSEDLTDSYDSSTSVNSSRSSSASVSGLSQFSEISTPSSTSSSTKSLNTAGSSTGLCFTALTFRFDSYRIRLNSLIDIFNIYLSLASNSTYITANGTFDFIKCILNYLQYKSNISIEHSNLHNENFFERFYENEIIQDKEESIEIESVKDKNEKNDQENDEDLYLSVNDYIIQERHYQLTSDYEHLCDLSNANNSNTPIKPFLLCIEKIFNILAKTKKEDFSSSVLETPVIIVRDFEIKKIEANTEFSIDWLKQNAFESYELKDDYLNFMSSFLEIEKASEFKNLNDFYTNHFLINDQKNHSKILIYLFKSLSSRICLAQDELNCVQIVQLIYDLLNRLIASKDFLLSGYLILEVLMQDLNFHIDLIEYKRKKDRTDFKTNLNLNEKLIMNTFFMSSLIFKRIDKLILLITSFLDGIKCQTQYLNDSFYLTLLNCIISRLIYILTKCVIKKLTNFDSIIDLNFVINLTHLFVLCFDLHNSDINHKCISSIKMFHMLSLIPFDTLLKHYGINQDEIPEESSEEDTEITIEKIENKSEYSNLEVLTQKCKTAWELHNVKRTFNLAKNLLYYEKSYLGEEDKSDSGGSSESLENVLKTNDENFLNEDSFTDCLNESDGENDEHSNEISSDDKNFYRDFTLKFNLIDSNTNSKNLFGEVYLVKQVNLTCFINSFKFHFNIINLMKVLCFKLNLDKNSIILYDFLRCFNSTYFTSLKLEQNLSLKILLSKIFYLNYDNCLANFINLTKCSFLLINYLYFKKDLLNSDLCINTSNDMNIQNYNYDSFKEYENFSVSTNDPQLKKVEFILLYLFKNGPAENFYKEYLYNFIKHFCIYHLELNEKSHNFKLEKSYLKNLLEKYENDEIKSNQSEESIHKEVLELFKKYKEQNKALMMLNLTKKTESTIIKSSENLKITENDKINLDSNNSAYLQKDSRYRYQIWSNEMIPYFILNLSSESNQELNILKITNFYTLNEKYSTNELLICLAQLMVVYNSCSSYCQCSASIENEINSRLDLKKVKNISTKLLSIILLLNRK